MSEPLSEEYLKAYEERQKAYENAVREWRNSPEIYHKSKLSIQLKPWEIVEYKIFCRKCGDSDRTEEYQFINDIHSDGDILLDENVVAIEDPCEICGCNLFAFVGRVRMNQDRK